MAKRGRKKKSELYQKAIGQDVETTEEVKNDKGEVIEVIFRKTHIPPDPSAIIEFLQTYGGEEWKK